MKGMILIVSLLFFDIVVHSQRFSKLPFKISGIKQFYKQGDNISFKIKNTTDTTVFFSSFILELYNNKDSSWYEQVYDVLNNECGEWIGKTTFLLKTDSTKFIIWNPKRIDKKCFNYKSNFGKYRLSFKYSLDVNNNLSYYLKDFKIIKKH